MISSKQLIISAFMSGCRHALAVTAVTMAALAALASPANAAFGDNYGMAPINGNAGGQAAPALAGQQHAFWAGACDIAASPPIGTDMAGDGGIGVRPGQIYAPNTQGHPTFPGNAFYQSPVTAPPTPPHCIAWGAPASYGNPVSALWTEAPAWRLPATARAGGHPDGSATFTFNRNAEPGGQFTNSIDGAVDNIYVDLPAGFVGNPNAVPKCTAEEFNLKPLECPAKTQVGVLHLEIEGAVFNSASNLSGLGLSEDVYPVYNLEPRHGKAAELGFAYASGERATNVRLVATARTNGDFGVTTFVGQIPAALPVIAQQITLWAVPWAEHNDRWRAKDGYIPATGALDPCAVQPGASHNNGYYIPPAGFTTPGCATPYDSSWGPIRPFLTNPTECDGVEDFTRLATDAYQHPGAFTAEGFPDPTDSDWKRYDAASPPVTGCEKNPFAPAASFSPTATAADASSGLNVSIDIPQNNDPPASVTAANAADYWRSDAGLATAHLDKTIVTLPEGMSVNPSAATGLRGCTDAQMGVTQVGNPYVFDNAEPTCPDGSIIGTAEATTPLLEGSPNLTGQLVLGIPKSTDPASGDMFRLFLVLRNKERGLLAKLHGTSVADPRTGQLTATFDKNPRVPVESIKVSLKGGSRGMLALPQSCGSKSTISQFTPWTAAHGAGGPVRDLSDSFTVGGDCSFGFSPRLTAGMSTGRARATGAFSFEFARNDGEQWIAGLTAVLPTGLLASVKDVPLCSNGQAASGSCPAGSRIGTVDAAAGSGTPFVLERKGSAFLTEGYKGCAYGLAVVVPVVAGPFDASSPATDLGSIVVRQKVCVDPVDAHVTATSDPLPTIHHGIPLRVRSVTVNVDRDKFMLNPSDCASKQVAGDFVSPHGAASRQVAPFHVSGCAALPFKPKLTLKLTGRKQTRTGKHPGVKAAVTQAGVPEAGIERAEVRLPKSLALDPDNAQALCEFDDGTKADLENHCPKGSIVGRARAVSPLLNRPLAGNVYFVKNVRRSASGNLIRTLPMVVVALRGEIAVNLKGTSDVKGGKLVNTFAGVPDAPITKFNMNIKGGKRGILAVTRTRRSRLDLCRGRHLAIANIDGHNGRRYDTDVRMKTPCKAPRKSGARKRSGA
jgi:hypothetical protein